MTAAVDPRRGTKSTACPDCLRSVSTRTEPRRGTKSAPPVLIIDSRRSGSKCDPRLAPWSVDANRALLPSSTDERRRGIAGEVGVSHVSGVEGLGDDSTDLLVPISFGTALMIEIGGLLLATEVAFPSS